MDLLCVPQEPSIPVDRTPYVCKNERWDCGPFLTYARRREKLRMIPYRLRTDKLESDPPFLELVDPTPQKEQETFYQTWFFFGLLAEFLALNEQQNGESMFNAAQANQELEEIYSSCCYVYEDETYLSGSVILNKGPELMKRIRQATVSLELRITYLQKCLRFTNGMLNSIECILDNSIKYSIAALAEIFSTAMDTIIMFGNLGMKVSAQHIVWSHGYLKRGGELEAKMLESGWCKSEVERIRSINGLHTIHFLSRLQKPSSTMTHFECNIKACDAFQIDSKAYEPKHVVGCQCPMTPETANHLEAILKILKTSASYPVLHIELSNNLKIDKINVEEYVPGLPYVAFSHVWADGLGNPKQNTLPQCQIENLSKLVVHLAEVVQTSSGSPQNQISYRLWIDTLCCPIKEINEEGNTITLGRMPDIYRNATHVLVLDASFSSYKSRDADPAEILLRIFHSSAWMRRLWTLQEGALAGSLFFQFADGPVKAHALLPQLAKKGIEDARYWRIWMDVNEQILNAFNGPTGSAPSPKGIMPPRASLMRLQGGLQFRAVTKPADEALCIGTLLSLDIKYIAAAGDAQERMVRFWELVANTDRGIPSQVIFFVDNPLEKDGWRWAPRSLLDHNQGNELYLDANAKIVRFATRDPPAPHNRGFPEANGLRVIFPGSRLRVIPRVDGMKLHPWKGIIKPSEDQLLARDVETRKWFRITDGYRSQMIASQPKEVQKEYDRAAADPLCRAIDDGDCALIRPKDLAFGGMQACLLVKINTAEKAHSSDVISTTQLHVKRLRQVAVSELNREEIIVAEVMWKMAEVVARDDLTKAIPNRESKDYFNVIEQIELRMKELVNEAWKTSPLFVEAVVATLGQNIKDHLWANIPKVFSHDICFVNLPEDQVWIVD